MLQATANHRSSRIVNAEELAAYEASATCRRAKRRREIADALKFAALVVIMAAAVLAKEALKGAGWL